MTKPVYANPRDANEQALLRIAERLGAAWYEAGPLDGWIVFRGAWFPVEIKLPEREGLKHEYTPVQKRFFAWCEIRRAKWFVWRDEADVVRDLGGRVSA